MEARQRAEEAERNLADLAEKSCRDGEETARLRKERDELCQTAMRLHNERGTTRRERDDAHRERDDTCQDHDGTRWQVTELQGEVDRERGLKLLAEKTAVGLVEISRGKTRVKTLEAEVSRRASEMDKLRAEVTRKLPTLMSLPLWGLLLILC